MSNTDVAPVHIGSSYIETAPIVAGAALAVALSFVLLTAGAAIGLSLVSAHGNPGLGKSAASIATAWALVATIGSFLAGGYIAGRMRMPWSEGNPDEVTFRDAIHGALVWSVSIVVGIVLATSATTRAPLLGPAVADQSSRGADGIPNLAEVIDNLLRAPPGALPAGWQPPSAAIRAEISRGLLAGAVDAKRATANSAYLAQIVASQTGQTGVDAAARVEAANAAAITALEDSRKSIVLVGLVTTTALLFGLVAAWYAAQRGGDHRDNNIPARFGAVFAARANRVSFSLK
jgi:hypothetical protein